MSNIRILNKTNYVKPTDVPIYWLHNKYELESYAVSGGHCFHRASCYQVQPAFWFYYYVQTCRTHHCDVEGVQQVKGQSSHQVHKEPGGGVVDADVTRLVNHLPWLAHEGGAEIQDDVWQ